MNSIPGETVRSIRTGSKYDSYKHYLCITSHYLGYIFSFNCSSSLLVSLMNCLCIVYLSVTFNGNLKKVFFKEGNVLNPEQVNRVEPFILGKLLN